MSRNEQTFVAKYIYTFKNKYTPECSMKNRELKRMNEPEKEKHLNTIEK